MNMLNRFSKGALLVASLAFFVLPGCQSPQQHRSASPAAVSESNAAPDNSITLREGDTLRVTFPNATKLDSVQQIRRDGKIVMPLFGELKVSGLTPAEVEKEILKQFGAQLVSKEVTVTLESSQFPAFVNGAVLHPGKITSNRPITALEAVMEAGGFDYAKANLKAVKVIRNEGAEVKTFVLDFRGVLKGEKSEPFYVKPSDIIYVPERFTLF